ncbi:MAG: hypothetical protein ABFD50_03690, partial [Smithella sp.]
IGYGGTGKSGRVYYYYACKNAKKKLCRKKIVNKEIIETRVVLECHKLLTEKNIRRLAKSVAEATAADYDSSTVKRLKDSLKEVDAAIEHLWKALESGQSVEMITERIEKRKQQKEEIQAQLSIEMGKDVVYTEAQIYNFLHSLKEGNLNDENNQRGIINIFLHSIYLKDDRFTLMLNGGDKPIVIDDILLDEIEADNADFECSRMFALAPPKNSSPLGGLLFFDGAYDRGVERTVKKKPQCGFFRPWNFVLRRDARSVERKRGQPMAEIQLPSPPPAYPK